MNERSACILEPDPSTRDQLEAYLTFTPGIRMLDERVAGEHMKDVDVLFLDLDVYGRKVEEIIRCTGERTKLVFMSADPSKAVAAFDLGATDLLLKPISYQRFQMAMKRVWNAFPVMENPHVGSIARLGSAGLTLKSGRALIEVDVAAIQLVQGMGNYAKLHLKDGHVLVNETLVHMEEHLPSGHFARVHRSYIIRIEEIWSIGKGSIEWRGGEIPIGASYKDRLLEITSSFVAGSSFGPKGKVSRS